MATEGRVIARSVRRVLSLPLWLAFHLAWITAASAQPSGCSWSGPSVESFLAQHPPITAKEGTLVAVVAAFQRAGLPVCLVAKRGNQQVRLASEPTLEEVLKGLVSQAPGYQFRSVDGRLVIYPQGQAFDTPVDLGPLQRMTRAAAYMTVLHRLSLKVKDLAELRSGISNEGAGWGKLSYSDTIEVGGSRTVIEHLMSLVQKRPALAFDVTIDGMRLRYEFVDTPLLTRLELHLPPTVKVGETFPVEVMAKLVDGATAPLSGPECWVGYATSNPEGLEIDDAGIVTARRKGTFKIYVNYQHVPAVYADVTVE